MQCFYLFLYSKSVNNLENLLSPSNKQSSNSTSSSFNPSILFIFSLADNLNSLSFLKSYGFHKIYILVLKSLNFHPIFLCYCLFHYSAYSIFFLLHFLFHYFFVLLMVSVFLSHSIYLLNLLVHP